MFFVEVLNQMCGWTSCSGNQDLASRVCPFPNMLGIQRFIDFRFSFQRSINLRKSIQNQLLAAACWSLWCTVFQIELRSLQRILTVSTTDWQVKGMEGQVVAQTQHQKVTCLKLRRHWCHEQILHMSESLARYSDVYWSRCLKTVPRWSGPLCLPFSLG